MDVPTYTFGKYFIIVNVIHFYKPFVVGFYRGGHSKGYFKVVLLVTSSPTDVALEPTLVDEPTRKTVGDSRYVVVSETPGLRVDVEKEKKSNGSYTKSGKRM